LDLFLESAKVSLVAGHDDICARLFCRVELNRILKVICALLGKGGSNNSGSEII
jgi:hypothetical protein